ncbi:anti-sigma factor [Clostridium weizhouense]|nr:anti-sigma factor [Clostridium weizhouense]
MKSDDERLRELFEIKEKPNFNKTIQKAKIFSIIRTTIVSLMVFIIASFVVFSLNATILNEISNKEQNNLEAWYNIAMPNAFLGCVQVDDRIMVGELDYTRYRYLGNKPIIDGSYKDGYSYMYLINGIYGDLENYLFDRSGKSEKDLNEAQAYNKAGKKVMKFYDPSVNYENYTNDLKKLDEIEGNKLMEISLSFDKAYDFEEVKNMIPSNITLNWYWVDTFTENSEDSLNKFIFDEYDVHGIKALDGEGKSLENPEKDFINVITRCKNNKDYSSEYQKLFDILSNGKSEINKEDLKIIGVVVSGDRNSLKALKDKNYIKAATIGAVADKY